MSKASRSFCQLDLAPMLEATASQTWTHAMREHALGCACCALRLGAIDRLSARLNVRLETGAATAKTRRAQPTRLARMVWGPVRRTATLAAVGVVATFLALAAGHGIGPGLALMSGPALDEGFPSSRRAPAYRWTSEDQARELASNGSLTPLPLFPLH
jgi:hypothetical protein